MKKTFLLLFLLTAAFKTFSQKTTFGIKAGFNFTNQAITGDNTFLSPQNTAGFQIGGIIDLGFKHFSLQPGILFTTKGTEFKVDQYDENINYIGSSISRIKLYYIEVPINLLYKLPISSGKVYLGGGPHLGYGISGSMKGGLTGGSTQTNLTFGNNGDYKNPDFGINFIGGYEFKQRLTLDMGYELGLINISNAKNREVKNQVLNFSVGYFFK